MSYWLLTYGAVGALFWVGQLWLLYGHRVKIGTDAGDRIGDHYATPIRMQLAFLALSAVGLGLVIDSFRPLREIEPLLVQPSFGVRLWSASLLGIAGFGLRIWAIKTLGRFFTFQIGIRAGHRVIQDGPYRLLRHPSYSGFLLFTAGFCLWAGSWILAAIVWVPSFVSLAVRIFDEERLLRGNFGAEYVEYSKTSYRLIPFIF